MKWVILIAPLIALAGCNSAENPVRHEFILPDGYKGVFKIVEDKTAGQPVKPVDGLVKITVPSNGIVMVKSTHTLQEWHKAVAVYKSGGILPFGVGALPDAESVAFFSLWTEANGTIYYLIGTKAEFDRLQKGSPWKADDYLPRGK